jgi:hypothetical protein
VATINRVTHSELLYHLWDTYPTIGDAVMPHNEIRVEIRTPSNEPHDFKANEEERVLSLAKEATNYFVEHHLLAPGEYGLALLEDGTARPLPDEARLEEEGVQDHSVLVLRAKKPKVDG